MAAKAPRPATAIELPTVLAAPVKVAMGEPVAVGGTTLSLVRCGFKSREVGHDLRSSGGGSRGSSGTTSSTSWNADGRTWARRKLAGWRGRPNPTVGWGARAWGAGGTRAAVGWRA